MISERQNKILEFIERFIEEHLFPPSIRQIQAGAQVSSTSVVKYNLEKLRRLGLLELERHTSRGMRLTEQGKAMLAQLRGEEYAPAAGRPAPKPEPAWGGGLLRIPLLGRIAAGEPIPIPGSDFSPMGEAAIMLTGDIVREQEGLYALEVRGDSMIDALIHDGDHVIMKHIEEAHDGEMVAVWLKDREETTLKRFYREKGRVRLQPANPTMSPIYVDPANVEIQGRVVAVVRNLQ
ncbi:MAG: repressor LexA [Thermoflexales bacterium]|nr:repressor LexA [Thermoflexales bacterium]